MIGLNGKMSKHDVQAGVNIVCCLLGIGSLAMSHEFAKAGPVYGTIALLTMCGINIYATVVLSQCFLHVPNDILTFSDLGSYAFGTFGRIFVPVTHLGTCLLLPIAFLILGGSLLLPGIFQGVITLDPSYWIVIMASVLMPVALIRTLDEAYWVMILGACTTILSIVFSLGDSAVEQPWNHLPTNVEAKNVFSVFGTMSLAYGAAIIVPTIQREHPNPKSMPKVIVLSLGCMTLAYFTIAVLGNIQFGCKAPSNLLLSMSDGVLKRISFALMQIHVMIALAAALNPAMFYFERNMFQIQPEVLPKQLETPVKDIRESLSSITSSVLCNRPLNGKYSSHQKIQSFIFRTLVVAGLTLLAILFRGSFLDVVSFIGATTISGCCIVMPCAIYLKLFRHEMSKLHQIFCLAVILLATSVGLFTAYYSLITIIQNASKYQFFGDLVSSDPVDYCFKN